MMKFLYAVLIVALVSVQAYAHLGHVSGMVYDQTTNQPVSGVTVQLTG